MGLKKKKKKKVLKGERDIERVHCMFQASYEVLCSQLVIGSNYNYNNLVMQTPCVSAP